MTTIVTGAAGFVGLNIVEALLSRGEDVVAFDLAPPPPAARAEFASRPGRLRVVEGDVRDDGALAALFR
ncbi:MAG TPA: NAD-dependent epimerase/dehydratase family protein, partial [Burkholderiales bacterium]|nr:NAD-dependent epimerase/dehydratase family protein [Burkholderiales bacterium]